MELAYKILEIPFLFLTHIKSLMHISSHYKSRKIDKTGYKKIMRELVRKVNFRVFWQIQEIPSNRNERSKFSISV